MRPAVQFLIGVAFAVMILAALARGLVLDRAEPPLLIEPTITDDSNRADPLTPEGWNPT